MVRLFILFIAVFFLIPRAGNCQFTEKIIFNSKDSTNDYYLAIPPLSGNIQGVQVLFASFSPPEYLLPETKLQNVAYGNDILTIMASMKEGLCADSASIERINQILKDVVTHFSADTSRFALGGFMYAGNIVLRYTELCYEHPAEFLIHPKAVFVVDCPVDLISLVRWSEREIRKNYSSGNVADAKYILENLTKKYGNYADHKEKYIQLSPFNKDNAISGNEQFLKNLPLRLYYDTDISWELNNRRNTYNDTYFPDGSEMVNRLLLAGNMKAEFLSSKLPGMRSSGKRNPHSWSIVDEVDCIQWIKQKLKIFNPDTYIPTYQLPIPEAWSVEFFALPPDFAQQIIYKGVEDVRFAPGWGDAKTEDYWTYAYLWWLAGNPVIDAESLQTSLKAYYTGLIDRNIPVRKITADKLFPTVVNIHPVKAKTGDLETWSGTISMLDYMSQTPMVLNTLIHKKNCPDKDHIILFFEISPKPSTHPIWQKLNKLNMDIECVKKPKA